MANGAAGSGSVGSHSATATTSALAIAAGINTVLATGVVSVSSSRVSSPGAAAAGHALPLIKHFFQRCKFGSCIVGSMTTAAILGVNDVRNKVLEAHGL